MILKSEVRIKKSFLIGWVDINNTAVNGKLGHPLKINFTNNITMSAISELIKDVTYSSTDASFSANRLATFSLVDNYNVSSNDASVLINTLLQKNKDLDDNIFLLS